MKFLTTLFLIFILMIQPCSVLAIEQQNKEIKDFEAEIKLQSKDQYQFKKVYKKYDPYLVTFTNKTDKTILLTTDTIVEFNTKDDKHFASESRRKIYRKTRSRDIGKYCGITLPCCMLGGGIIGLTFGLGIPVALGVFILGVVPVANANKTNSGFAQDMYVARKLPLRMSPNETYQIRILAPKETKIQNIIFTNLVFENDKTNTRYNLNLPIGAQL